MNVETADPVGANVPSRRPLFLVGVAVFLLGAGIYLVQFFTKQWIVPWYLPVLGTAGVGLMIVATFARPTWGKKIVAGLFILLTLFEWHFLIWGSRLPDYAGPVKQGSALPAFEVVRADGMSFTQADMATGGKTVLVFFRGRW